MLKIFAAPLQGYTEAPWRNAHEAIFGGVDAYYTPFVRVERGGFRHKDMRDVAPSNNSVQRLIPQVLAGEADELCLLIDQMVALGYKEVDLNMGCPFPPIASGHKGAGILPYPDKVTALMAALSHYPEVAFSVKMRLGWESAEEWKSVLPILNEARLQHVVMHPRVGKQQYKGEVDKMAMAEFCAACAHPVIYNGDVNTLEDVQSLVQEFPTVAGFMLGRGLLGNPDLAHAVQTETSVDERTLINKVGELHQRMLDYYQQTLQGGDLQVLSKLKPQWEYWLPNADRKLKKAIHKATRFEKYMEAVHLILRG